MNDSKTFPFGIHPGIPAADYHKAKGISNSGLKLFGGLSPAHYISAVRDGNVEEPSKAMYNGTLLHLLLLEPEKFGGGVSHYVRPDEYPASATHKLVKSGMLKVGDGLPWNGNATFCSEWLEARQDKPVLSQKAHQNLLNAQKAVMAHPAACNLLTGKGSNEVSVFAKHESTGLTLKIRCDRIKETDAGKTWIVDIKTCPDVRRFEWTARDFRYDVQAAYYSDVLEMAGAPDVSFAFIVVELEPTNAIHGVRVLMLDERTMDAARAIYHLELAYLTECKRTDIWPGFSDDIEVIRVKRFTESVYSTETAEEVV